MTLGQVDFLRQGTLGTMSVSVGWFWILSGLWEGDKSLSHDGLIWACD